MRVRQAGHSVGDKRRDILSCYSVHCQTTWQLRREMMGSSKIEVILLMIESRLKSTMGCDIAYCLVRHIIRRHKANLS